jgi:glutathione S-transferase
MTEFRSHYDRCTSAVLKQNNDGRTSVGQTLTYVDLSLLQLMQGLRYAFPKTMRDHAKCYPALTRLHDAVMARPKINAYLNPPRRLPFSEEGIFRHYPELDIAP